jgi:hypothetical protein
VYEYLLESNKEPHKGFTLNFISKAIETQFPEIMTDERKKIVKLIDRNQDGNSDFHEVRSLFSELSSTNSIKLILLIMARLLGVKRVATEKFLKDNGVNLTDKCSLAVFLQKVATPFELTSIEATELFKKLQDPKSGDLSIENLVGKINYYRGQEEITSIKRKNVEIENLLEIEEKKGDNSQPAAMPTNSPEVEALLKFKAELKKVKLTPAELFNQTVDPRSN